MKSILLVTWDDVSQEETTPVLCPQLEAFRATAFETTNCWSHPVCSQSRGALTFGAWGKTLGTIQDLHATVGLPPAGFPSLPGVLSAANYKTALIGKWHCGHSPTGGPGELAPIERGYQEWHAGTWHNIPDYSDWSRIDSDSSGAFTQGITTQYATLAQLEAASAWWLAHSSERRFMHVAFNVPHGPIHVPPTSLLAGMSDPGPLASNRQKWLRMLRSADTAFGQLLTLVGPNTHVFLCSDNGTAPQASGPGMDKAKMKSTTYRLGCHVLAVARWAGCPVGPDDKLQHLVDFPAAILAIAGVAQPPEWDSQIPERAYVLSEARLDVNGVDTTDRGVRTSTRFLRQSSPTGTPFVEELYDTVADVGEDFPLDLEAPENAATLSNLRGALTAAEL